MLVSQRVPAGLGEGASALGPDVVFPALSLFQLTLGRTLLGLGKPRLKDSGGTSDLGRERSEEALG